MIGGDRKLYVRASALCLLLLITLGCAPSTCEEELVVASPSSSVAHRLIYVADQRAQIRAVNTDGSTVWTFPLGAALSRAHDGDSFDYKIEYLTVGTDGVLFGLAKVETGARAGGQFLFAVKDNDLVWQVETTSPEHGRTPVVVDNNAAYISGADGTLYAFAQNDGRLLWRYQTADRVMGEPVLGADGTIYGLGEDMMLHAVSPDGTAKWAINIQEENHADGDKK